MIKVLDKSVSELIAAGEVIEKPASVVKELIENSIDAGAKSITVEIKNGGVSFLRITDDGCGIPHDECPTAFLRHATSKVSTKGDLTSIATLGFRGEALASVSAVSRVSLLTKTCGTDFGTSYKIEAGYSSEHEKAGCPDGTTIIIRDLFFNTPARLKFLKKDVSEGNYVGVVIDKAALINPHIAFRFIRDNKLVRVTPGDGKLYSAIYAVYGKQFAVGMTPVECSQNGVLVNGYTSMPLFCKNNRAFQNFYVNSRYIKSLTCASALEEAYRNSIMTGKFPACVLNIAMNPADVDANVHPAKTEVRFVNDRAVFSAVHIAVKNALLNADYVEIETAALNQPTPPTTLDNCGSYESIEPPKTVGFSSVKADYAVVTPVAEPMPAPVIEFRYIKPEAFIKKDRAVNQSVLIEREYEHSRFRVMGELFSTYIICEQGEELVLIDKHAADERIRFDRLKSQLRTHSQLLIEPAEVQLEGDSYSALLEAENELEQVGVRLEFDSEVPGLVRIIAMPTIAEGVHMEEVLLSIANSLNSCGTLHLKELGIVDEILHRIACRSAIKAGDKSVSYDIEQLARKVLEDTGLRYCPHGRPITVRITKRELEKKFKRI